MGPTKERSRGGCLPCLQKRKKCDEVKPTCTRCSKYGTNHCIWRSSLPKPKSKSRASVISLLSQTQPFPHAITNIGSHGASISAEAGSVSRPNSTQLVQNINPCGSILDTELSSVIGGDYAHSQTLCDISSFQPMTKPTCTPQSTHLLQNLEASSFNSTQVGCANRINIKDFLDEDEAEVTKTLEWIPEALEVYGPYLPPTDQVNWLSAFNSYFMFSSRYVYESSNLLGATRTLSASYGWVNSARLGLLGTAALFHSYINPVVAKDLREHSRKLIDAATTSIQLEMTQPAMPVSAKLAGLSVVLLYHYYSGDLNAYIRCIEAAAPMVKALVGPYPVEFHDLRGAETIDIRSFVWCDIFTAIAASQPTRLIYDCNAEILCRKNQMGPNPVDMTLDVGLEWMCGLPDAILMLIIQIINLHHSSLSRTERLIHAAGIEKSLRDWKVWPSKTPNSVMRVQRMGAQEIWRYFAILYLYQAIHQAPPSHDVVRQSVGQIFRLGSMLRPGHNPDCLLTVPYFVAGTFAVLAKHQQFFRERLLGCGIETYGQTLANALEELWQKQPDTGRYNDWTTRSSPIVIFS
ncbi:hypothetical protein ACGC1H_001678 [Rhizoctonia solani]|uniref:Zn(2)-C6 fungal-type domain-containing protein n=1 Tax=Rhizoctonia solani TaxID=456999 RepID=A0A8H3B2N0_9AGAM|nr:unnamed protein product [Rhizoctonia solani]